MVLARLHREDFTRKGLAAIKAGIDNATEHGATWAPHVARETVKVLAQFAAAAAIQEMAKLFGDAPASDDGCDGCDFCDFCDKPGTIR